MVSILFPVPDGATSASPNAALPPRDSWWHRSRIGRLASTLLFLASQVLLLDLLYMLYRMGRHLAVGREAQALTNAQDVWNLERLLNLPNESTIQQLALHSSHLLELANRFYVGVHFPASIVFLLWVLLRHRDTWPRVRMVIVSSTSAALLIHMLYPLAPPRFLPRVLPHVTLVDTGAVFGPTPYTAGDTVANQYAAMPSLHVGWSILVAWGVITILRARARWLVLIHPVLTVIVVVITANHYWMDGAIGGALVGAAVLISRPAPWGKVRSAALGVLTLLRPARPTGRAHDPVSLVAAPVTRGTRAAVDLPEQRPSATRLTAPPVNPTPRESPPPELARPSGGEAAAAAGD